MHFILISAHHPLQLICCCIEELGLARALRAGDMAAARGHRANMATYHQHRAMHASALIAMFEGSYHTALVETQRVLEAQRRWVCQQGFVVGGDGTCMCVRMMCVCVYMLYS